MKPGQYPCGLCSQPISRKGRAAHMKAKHPADYKPRPKYQSRAARLDAAIAALPIGSIEEAKDAVQTWLDENDADDLPEGTEPDFEPIGAITIPDDFDTSEVESLIEEMESWRDNMEEKLGHTMKFEEVSQACDDLESVRDAIEEANSALADARDAHDPTSKDREDIEALLEALETAITAAESIDASSVSFPGMY